MTNSRLDHSNFAEFSSDLTTHFIFQSDRIDPAQAFRLAFRMEISELRGTKSHLLTGFYYPKVIETSGSFKSFRDALHSDYGWSPSDAGELSYFNSSDQRFVPLICDEHLGLLFSLNADNRFAKINIDV